MSLMTDLKALARKFRKAADTLDALVVEDGTETKAVEIRKTLHWTQRPENRSRVIALAKKRHMMRKAG